MEVTNKIIDQLANLSKLQFDQEQKENIRLDLEKMIDFVNKIEELDTDNVEPLIHVNEEINVLREDVVKETISQTQALKNAPSKDSDYFKIPTVLSK